MSNGIFPHSPVDPPPVREGVSTQASTQAVGPYTYDPARTLEEYKAEMRKVIDGLTAIPEWSVLASTEGADEDRGAIETRVYHHGQPVGFLREFHLHLFCTKRGHAVEAQCHYGRIPTV